MIKVSPLQKGNGLLLELQNSSWHYEASISADYEINFSTAVLFLSLKFYASKPEYIFRRLSKLKDYKLKVLLVHVDSVNYNKSLQELFRTIPITIVLAKDYIECANYIRGFDTATLASDEILRQKDSSVEIFLGDIPNIGKSEIQRLKNNFSTLQDLISAKNDEISGIFGVGKAKAESLTKYFNMSFKK